MDRYIIRTVKGSEGKRIENGGHDGGSTNLKPLGNADDTEVAQKTNVTVQGNEYNISNNKTKALNKELLSESDDPSHNIPINRLERENRIKRGPYQPKMASFPRSKKGTKCRSFQNNWYDTYGWLEYSKSLDAVFCFFCRFFGSNDSAHKGHIDSAFIRKGFDKWHKAHEGFKKHETSVGHLQSISSWTNYKTGKSVDVLLDENKQAQISKQEQIRLQNRQVFDRFINIVLCLVKAGKPLRGHNENTSSYEKGLFLDIVDLISKYDPVLKQHIESGPANAKYLSSKIQNDIILSLHNVILRKIASSLENKKISIISDDTSDVGHHEQMSVVVRHYDEKRNMPAEHFVALQRLISVDALSIFNELHSVISKLGIKWSNVVSVCFDGASTMSGCTAGVQAKCKEKNSNILYVHCYAHCLNLVLVDACTSSKQNRVLFDFFGVIQYLYTFIEGSCTRHAVLEKIAASVDVTLKSLKSLSTTRWACRAEAVAAVKNNYIAIILALEEIVDTTRHADVKAKGRGLLYQIKTFEFIFALNIMHPILQLILKVSKTLQSLELNLLAATECVKSLRSTLSGMRNDEYFSEQFNIVLEICEKNDISIPTVKKRKVSRNTDDASHTQYFNETKYEEMKISSFYPLLDTMVTELDLRFSQETLGVVNAVCNLINLKIDKGQKTILSQTFSISEDELEAEISLLINCDSIPKENTSSTVLLKEWLKWLGVYDRCRTFKLFTKVVKEFTVIPVTSCSCERVFSKLTHVKSKLRSTMTQDRLQNLMLLYVEQELAASVNIDAVIDEFKAMVPFERRFIL